MADKTPEKTFPKSPKQPTKADTGTLGYRHLPNKTKRWHWHREKRPTDLKRIPGAVQITKKAALVLWNHRGLFLSLAVIYGLLNLLLVQGLANSSDISTLKTELSKANFGSVVSGVSIFAVLAGSSGSSSSAAGTYQVFLLIITSLAVIWSLRQVMSGQKIRIRDAYYQGMYPLIPFILVLLMIMVQLLPLAIGAGLYNTVITNLIAVNAFEKIIFLLIFLALAYWSVYMVCSSLFALYIATLPNMTPIKALKSAKQLAKFRRLSIFRKLLFLMLILLVVSAVIMLPIILWITPLARWVFFILAILELLFAISYLYAVYRELLE